MTVLYPNAPYNEVCYKGNALYIFTILGQFHIGWMINWHLSIFIYIHCTYFWDSTPLEQSATLLTGSKRQPVLKTNF